jgi:hypothetical protein
MQTRQPCTYAATEDFHRRWNEDSLWNVGAWVLDVVLLRQFIHDVDRLGLTRLTDPVPSQAEIARHLKVSRAYICKLVKRGMPLDSFQLAKDWKDAHASSRAPTDAKQLARLIAEENGDSPAIRRKECFKAKPVRHVRSTAEDTLDEALYDAIEAAREAYRLLREAMLEDKDQKISVRIGLFNKASENRFKAETAHREELERRKILVPLDVAQDWFKRGLDVIITRLRCLPQNVASRCNPANANHAMEVLEVECNGILAEAQQIYAADPV